MTQEYIDTQARESRRWWYVLWALALCGPFIVVGAAKALAHDALPTAAQPLGWQYGWDCCSAMDCKQVSDAEIEETPDGYLVKASGTLIPYNSKKLRDSKDQFFHLCTRGGKPDGEVLCLYRAPRGM